MKGSKALTELYARASIHTEIDDLHIILECHSCIKKEQKALALIIRKRVDIKDLFCYTGYDQYNYCMLGVPEKFKLTEKEYNFLVEVVRNETKNN